VNTANTGHEIKKQLVSGCEISYKLRLSQAPTNEEKLWRGKVLRTILDAGGLPNSVIIESLEPGHERETEIVFLDQIVEVSPA
jgi:hypothetical protein